MEVTRSCQTVCDAMDYASMQFSRPEYWSGKPFPCPGDFPNAGIEPRSPALQADSLPTEPPGKPKDTGVGSVCLLQWIFLTEKLNWDVLFCRQLLYQLSVRDAWLHSLPQGFREERIRRCHQCSSAQSLSRGRLSATP